MPENDKTSVAYLITYDGEFKNVAVETFDSKELAVDASGKSPKEKSMVVQDTSDLSQFDGDQLVTIYNGITGSSLARFRSKENGMERILMSVRGLAQTKDEDVGEANIETHKEEPEVSVKKPKAAKRAKAEKKPASEKKAGAKKTTKVDEDKKIALNDTFAEFKARLREGGERAADFDKMKAGIKISTYLANGGGRGNLLLALRFKLISFE